MNHFLRLLFCLCSLALGACTGLPPASSPPPHYQHAYKAETRLLKTPENLTLFGQWWLPPEGKETRAVVLLVHGAAVHSGFYAPWAEELGYHGYAVFGIDLRGWGQSQGFGRRGYVRSYDEYLRDLRLAYQEVHRRYPDKPLFLQGESTGGSVVLLSHIMNQFPVSGMVLNAPAVKPNPGLGLLRLPGPVMGLGLWGAGTAARVWPNFPVVPLDIKLVQQALARAIVADSYIQQRYLEDPFCTHSALPAAFISGLEEASSRIQDNFVNIQAPFLVLQGGKDHLVPVASSQLLVDKAGSPDKTLRIYEGVWHGTLHDKGKEKVWADIVAWLDAHMPAPVGTIGTATASAGKEGDDERAQ